MPRSDDESPRDRRRRDRYRDHSRSSSRDRDRRRRRDSHSRRRSISSDRKKSYDRSPASHRSRRRSTSRHRSSRADHKKSRHRRHRSSSDSSASSRSTYSSRSKSRKRSSSPDVAAVKKESPPQPQPKPITLESSANEEKRQQLIEEIDADSFVPKTFTSTKKVPDKVIIDLQKETVSVPQAVKSQPAEDQIIHPNFLANDEDRTERWIRKLFIYRQKNSDQ